MMTLLVFAYLMLLADKSVLVTGAANRLGAQIARTLHQNGANLIIHYRDSVKVARALVDDLNGLRANSTLAIKADLGSMDELKALATSAAGAYGGLDILVNNASSFYPTSFGEIDLRAWEDLIDSNYKAPLFLSQACYPGLRQNSGCIISMVDIYAFLPLKHHSVYCSAKAANQMLVKSLALELAPEVRVNGIAPGAILWPDDDAENSADQQQVILQKVPLKRCGTPQAIADTVLFLAVSDYITGEIIRVDGGRLLTA